MEKSEIMQDKRDIKQFNILSIMPNEYILLWVLFLVGFLWSVLFFVSMFSVSGGHLMAPLDDTFIHFQYAKRLSQGYFFSYTQDAGYSTGATSILYPIILSPFFLIGFSGVKILIPAYLIGVFSLIFTAFGIYFLGRNIANIAVGFGAGLLFLLNGNILWSYFSGMETGLYTLFIIWLFVFYSFFIKTQSKIFFNLFIFFIFLISLTRPEALYLAIITIVIILNWRLNKRINTNDVILFCISLIPALTFIIFNKLFTGSTQTNGMLVKGILFHPLFNNWDKLQKITETFIGIFSGYYENLMGEKYFREFQGRLIYPYFPPFILFFFVIGFFPKLYEEIKNRKIEIFSLGFIWFFLGICSTSLIQWSFVHHQRYHVPYQPIFFLFAVNGIWILSNSLIKNSRYIFNGILLFMWIISFPSVFFWMTEYGENCSDIYNQHRRMSWYVKDTIPEDEVIGLSDVGVISYYNQHKVYDLLGLVTNNQAESFSKGVGSVYEKLESLPEQDRPSYIITYQYWFGEDSFLGDEIHRVTLLKNTVTSGGYMSVFKQNWQYANSGNKPYLLKDIINNESWEIVDSIDVADVQSEKYHQYICYEDSERLPFEPPYYQGNLFKKSKYIINDNDKGTSDTIEVWDGGRAITGGEKFVIKVKPNKPLLLVFRTDSAYPLNMSLKINDEQFENRDFIFAKTNDDWKEYPWLIPAKFITSDKLKIEIIYKWDHVRNTLFRSFYYWALQEKD